LAVGCCLKNLAIARKVLLARLSGLQAHMAMTAGML